MGKFLENEKRRQAKFKANSPYFSEAARADGVYKSKLRPFCLSLDCAEENLFPEIRQTAPAYFAISIYRANHKYNVSKYFNDGIVFMKKNKTHRLKDRIIFYDKRNEIMRDDKIQKYINPDRFSNILRVESNLKSFLQLRKYLKIGKKNLLNRVLNSNEKVNFNIFNNVTKTFDNISFNYSENMKLKEIEKIKGRKVIIKENKYKPDLIRNYIKEKFSKNSNIGQYYRGYQNLLFYMLKEKASSKNSNLDILMDEIKESLLSN